MKSSVIIFLFLSTLFLGCKEEQKEVNPESASEEISEVSNMKAIDWKSQIQLDAGTQWQANDETTEGIQNMAEMIENSTASGAEDLRQLGHSLNKEKNLLIKRCTMKGPSHDNLHIYLEPLINKISLLMEVKTVEKGEQLVSEITDHLNAYQNYFN